MNKTRIETPPIEKERRPVQRIDFENDDHELIRFKVGTRKLAAVG